MRNLSHNYLNQIRALFAEPLLEDTENTVIDTSFNVTSVSLDDIELVECDYSGFHPPADDDAEPATLYRNVLVVEFDDETHYYISNKEEAESRLTQLVERNAPDIIIANQKRLIKLYEIKDQIPE